ncbi:DUF1344 domain-containing protein [Mesorhizobium sp. KR1-2]|uniref:DUF1344 domain-containing protein n=1 Tax=Mesorhizobium sp. KR1-2 TaxID=3156609 RepID=UPI0032B44182
MKTILGTMLMSMLIVAPAFAGEMEGTIKSIDMKKHMLMMDDGMSIQAKPEVKLNNLKAGEHVKIMTDSDQMATSVEKMQ